MNLKMGVAGILFFTLPAPLPQCPLAFARLDSSHFVAAGHLLPARHPCPSKIIPFQELIAF